MLKSSKLLPSVVRQEYFNAFLTCFLAHRTRSIPATVRFFGTVHFADNHLFIYYLLNNIYYFKNGTRNLLNAEHETLQTFQTLQTLQTFRTSQTFQTLQTRNLFLNFLAHPRHRDIQLFAVFGHRAPGNNISSCFKHHHQHFVRHGFTFIFVFNTFQ